MGMMMEFEEEPIVLPDSRGTWTMRRSSMCWDRWLRAQTERTSGVSPVTTQSTTISSPSGGFFDAIVGTGVNYKKLEPDLSYTLLLVVDQVPSERVYAEDSQAEQRIGYQLIKSLYSAKLGSLGSKPGHEKSRSDDFA
jgi:hypothetical protein